MLNTPKNASSSRSETSVTLLFMKRLYPETLAANYNESDCAHGLFLY